MIDPFDSTHIFFGILLIIVSSFYLDSTNYVNNPL